MLPEWFQQLGIMGWPLAICSIITVMISIERLIFHANAWLKQEQQFVKLSDYLSDHKSLPKPNRDEMVEIMLAELQHSYFNGTRLLRMIGTISPIIGLLGTILGIIAAFKVISVQTGPVSPSMIADGLWEAMLTTAAGLMIALPALLLAYLFHHLADRQISKLCLRLNKLSMSFEMDKQTSDSFIDNNVERLSA